MEQRSARCDNISLGGMFVSTQTPEPIGRTFFVEMTFGPPGDFSAMVQVVWSRQRLVQTSKALPGMGVKFLRTDQFSFGLLESILQELLTESDRSGERRESDFACLARTDQEAAKGNKNSGIAVLSEATHRINSDTDSHDAVEPCGKCGNPVLMDESDGSYGYTCQHCGYKNYCAITTG